jgi:hypothetical protein
MNVQADTDTEAMSDKVQRELRINDLLASQQLLGVGAGSVTYDKNKSVRLAYSMIQSGSIK